MPRTAAYQASLSMGFSRQGYWSGLPFPSPGNLPNPEIKPESPSLQADSLLTELWRKPLISSRVFLISVILLFVSVCLFFHFSRPLLIDSCIFSILFPRFLIIFTIIILNFFSGSLPMSSSFIWTSVFLVYSLICVVFLCLFIIFLTYCVWGPLFPGFKVEFFLPFGFCPPKLGPVVCVSFVYLCWVFACFSSDG